MRYGVKGWPYGPQIAYKRWDPYAPDDNPHPLTCEFATPNDIARFTPVNMSTNGTVYDSATTLGKGLYIEPPNQQYRWRSVLRALTGEPEWTIHAGVDWSTMSATSLTCAGGIVLSTTAATNTGSQALSGVGSTGDVHAIRIQMTWANFGETAGGAGSTNLGIGAVRHIYVRKAGGVYFAGWSPNGEVFYDRSWTVGITPAHVGLAALNYTGSNGFKFAFNYFRFYPVGNQFKTGRLVTVYR